MDCEHLGVLEELLMQRSVAYKYVKLFEGESIPDLEPYSGVILLGGPMNVYEEKEYPFLRHEDRLIKSALKRGTPLLGICLGAQLIAKAAGARVYRGREKEIGWYTLYLTPEARLDRLFRGFEAQMTVFQWHGDTFDVPEGGVRLAGSSLFTNQAFLIGAATYALQFHLEVSAEMIREWAECYRDDLVSLNGTVDREALLRDADRLVGALNLNASQVCENFTGLLR
ncbi:MAG: type 1 glutamine amidotransferase [Thaumarchaeota archaeon]|nr:type 1 glutamine amidotransferase [Nitrososphaerota archaeon]